MPEAKIFPGARIGVLGGGQLGGMFAAAATRMGYLVEAFSDTADCPAARVCDRVHVVDFADEKRLASLAGGLAAVTLEFENIPARAAAAVAAVTRLRPSPEVLFTTQDRGREKAFLAAHGFPCVRHALVRGRDDLPRAAASVGFPSVLKTTAFGYDGKGQRKVGSPAELEAAFDAFGGQETVLEEWVEFECELSVVAARGEDGAIAAFAPSRNEHANHILDVAVAPSGLAEPQVREARGLAEGVLETLGVVGTACVEMFLARDGRLLVNEIAPRPHNSGHLTIDACETSQFEQQVRALCGLPLGSPRQVSPAAMVNLLGDCWANGEPDWAAALGVPGVRLSLYGKSDPRPGRKMGHLTAVAATAEEAVERALLARRLSSAGRANGPSSSC